MIIYTHNDCFKKFNDMFIHKNIIMDLNKIYKDLLNNQYDKKINNS